MITRIKIVHHYQWTKAHLETSTSSGSTIQLATSISSNIYGHAIEKIVKKLFTP